MGPLDLETYIYVINLDLYGQNKADSDSDSWLYNVAQLFYKKEKSINNPNEWKVY